MEKFQTTMVEFEGETSTLYHTVFKILWKWNKLNRSKNTLINLLLHHTPLTEEEIVDWVIELRPPDIQEWADTELGKEYINRYST